jgi:hypothetical protein
LNVADDPMNWPIDVFQDTERDLARFNIEDQGGWKSQALKATAERMALIASMRAAGIPPLFVK